MLAMRSVLAALFAILDFMTPAALRRFCASRPGAEASYPFGPGARVYKVGGKMFALIPDDTPLRVSLKCEPALGEILREQFPAVTAAYHFNKRHWISVAVAETPDELVREWTQNSYDIVVASLTRAARDTLRTRSRRDR